jgi:hypothetical protein
VRGSTLLQAHVTARTQSAPVRLRRSHQPAMAALKTKKPPPEGGGSYGRAVEWNEDYFASK